MKKMIARFCGDLVAAGPQVTSWGFAGLQITGIGIRKTGEIIERGGAAGRHACERAADISGQSVEDFIAGLGSAPKKGSPAEPEMA